VGNFLESKLMIRILPYKSVGNVLFGATKADCIAKFGVPEESVLNREGLEELKYSRLIVRIDPSVDQVVEFTLLPFCEGTIEGIEITWDQSFLSQLCRIDGGPREVFGFIVLPRIGVAVTGIHDDDSTQLAMTVFPKGAFDELLKSGTPYASPSSYWRD
jgi:hypothetical protein